MRQTIKESWTKPGKNTNVMNRVRITAMATTCIARCRNTKQNIFFFLHDMRVPITNNTAEHCLRDYKRKQTFAMTFRSLESIVELYHSKSVLRGV